MRTARRPSQLALKEINPKYSLGGLMLKLKLQILRPPDAKSPLTGEDPEAGKDWGQEEKGRQDETVRWPWTWEGASSGRYWKTGKPGMLQSTGLQRVRHDWVTEQQHEPKSKHWWPYLQRQGMLLQFPSSSLPPLAWVTTVFSQVLFLLLPLTPLWSKFRTVTRDLIQELTRL